jgi:hypothetical protein
MKERLSDPERKARVSSRRSRFGKVARRSIKSAGHYTMAASKNINQYGLRGSSRIPRSRKRVMRRAASYKRQGQPIIIMSPYGGYGGLPLPIRKKRKVVKFNPWKIH